MDWNFKFPRNLCLLHLQVSLVAVYQYKKMCMKINAHAGTKYLLKIL
jgi:hypothetical protein